jgi:hypothetical protein
MIQSSLKICARRPAQGAVPLLKSTFVESERWIRGSDRSDAEIHTKISS